MNKQSIGYTLIFTFVVSFVFVFLLAMANQTTVERVRLNQQLARQRGILDAMDISYGDQTEVQALFSRVEVIDRDGTTLYRTVTNGTTVYAKEFVGAGLWGAINGVIGVDEALDRIVALKIIAHNETPGLGGRIDERWWQDQFRDQSIPAGTLRVGPAGTGNTDTNDDRVDAITGATRTSDAMQVIVNDELAALRSLIRGGSR